MRMTTITSVFEALGLSSVEERVYESLLDRPGATLRDLTKSLDLASGQIQKGLTLLRRKGFVSESAARPRQYMPAPPEAAVEVLVLRREEELQHARLAAAGLSERHRAGLERARTGDLLEMLTGPEASAQRFHQLVQGAQREILVIDRPPYAGDFNAKSEVAGAKATTARGVKSRTIYAEEALEVPGRLTTIRELMTIGDEVRVLPTVQTKLVIVDRRVGLIPLNLRRLGIEDAVVIHASFLLDALVMLFEALWERATPLGAPADADRSRKSDRKELLQLLAAGLKDDSIARALGQSRSTVARRIKEVMVELGAKSRFQAGVLAERRLHLQD